MTGETHCGFNQFYIYLEKVITPLIQSSKSFILDTGAFLRMLRDIGNTPPNAILVTLDVKDLYTSIPHSEGINSVHKLLAGSNMNNDQISLCIELLTVIQTMNFFMFQDNFYLQTRDTAMGSNVAPPYANCYMADFEESSIYNNTLFRCNVLMWKRFIDDIFCIWGGISFTMSHDNHRISFLDTTIMLNPNGSIRRHCHLLSSAHPDIPEFKEPFLPCFKQAPNLKDSLVRADLGPKKVPPHQRFLQNPRTGTFPCLHCTQCNNVQKSATSTIHSPERVSKFLNFSRVIYLIKCPCGLLYVGETTQPIRDRISKHKSTIRCKNLLLPIPFHFVHRGHNITHLKF
ncbi:unnamed protein product [Ranitomeya imitator]|uniref:Reverse transcriptase domain-containing protein n=1 Tax=Ranitomeya imitator TaxID=111125 RepID=A0ABN9LM77_9NEOB|nr:unnamed protein product [Ranitomeya imitator]